MIDETRTRDNHAANADIDTLCDATPEIAKVPATAAATDSGSFVLMPLAIGAGLALFVTVLVAGRRQR